MSTYRKIFETVEEAVFSRQLKNSFEISKYVQRALKINNVNESEIRKIIDRVATQYKQNEKN